MTMTIETAVCNSLFLNAGSFFASTIELAGYRHMQQLLGGECEAIQLTPNILIWYKPYENVLGSPDNDHTLTILKGNQSVNLYGNILITSNDDNNLDGIRGLSDQQHKWLGQHSELIISEHTGNYIIQFRPENSEGYTC